ncbi:MAG: DUF2683 family protein [Nanoarchaeota archaeon]
MYMVNAMIQISDQANQVLNIVKARHNLKDKSQAIELVTLAYGQDLLEPQLRPEFIEKMMKQQHEPTIRIDSIAKHFGVK